MPRSGVGVNEPAIGHENRGRFAVLVQEPLYPLGERQCRPGRLGRDNEDRSPAVVGDDAGAVASQRAPEAATETAQALEALLSARGQVDASRHTWAAGASVARKRRLV